MHQMDFLGEVAEGDEYFCPKCYRHIIINCQTGRTKVLTQGSAIEHTGGRGGLTVKSFDVLDDDYRLKAFDEFMETLDD